VADDVLGNAAHEQALQAAPAVRAAYDELGRPVIRLINDGLAGSLAGAAIAALLAVWLASRRPVAPRYLTTAVTRGTVERTVTATGTVNPVMTIIIGSYVSGVIRDVY